MTLEQFINILRARKITGISIFFAIILATLVISFLLPKQYTSDAALAVDVKATDPVTGQQVAGFLAPSFMATQVEMIASQNGALKVVDALGLAKLPEAQAQFMEATKGRGDIRNWFAESLLKGLEVKPSRESNVINLSYTATDPQFAAALANAFTQAYIRTTVDIKMASAQQNNIFFQEQLKTLQANLEKTQQKLSEYQQEKGIVATDERLDIEMQRLNEISSQLVGAQAQTFDAQARARGGQTAPDVLNNPLILQLKGQLSAQEAKLKELAVKNGPNHPHYRQALAEVTATQNQLNELMLQYSGGLSGVAGNSQSRQAALNQAMKAQKERVLELKSGRANIDVLQRNVDNAQRSYDQALQRFSQTMLESRADQSNITILKSAIAPLTHSKPRTSLNMLLAVFVGALLAVASILVLEFLNRRIRTKVDIESYLGLHVLAELGKEDAKKLFGNQYQGKRRATAGDAA
ncbi:chain length determinant protein EpsF [Iodobacter sp. HSC-16F04]|uniref:Chain length determinant protein EpsF n=1 Tax=Iodobacter violaceini TaxID=3044271 RepID=A0ABX0KTZ9_9NEIS|nr:chain length determinant protein EpsF [Iodobacter violacea]NHQ85942.1 chain length determinant protein EpsF [Iodobacter violacea]